MTTSLEKSGTTPGWVDDFEFEEASFGEPAAAPALAAMAGARDRHPRGGRRGRLVREALRDDARPRPW